MSDIFSSYLWWALGPPCRWSSSADGWEPGCRHSSWWQPCCRCLSRRRCCAVRHRPCGGLQIWGGPEAPPEQESPSAGAHPFWSYHSRNTGAAGRPPRWTWPGRWGVPAWRWPQAGPDRASAGLCGCCRWMVNGGLPCGPDWPCCPSPAERVELNTCRGYKGGAHQSARPRQGHLRTLWKTTEKRTMRTREMDEVNGGWLREICLREELGSRGWDFERSQVRWEPLSNERKTEEGVSERWKMWAMGRTGGLRDTKWQGDMMMCGLDLLLTGLSEGLWWQSPAIRLIW